MSYGYLLAWGVPFSNLRRSLLRIGNKTGLAVRQLRYCLAIISIPLAAVVLLTAGCSSHSTLIKNQDEFNRLLVSQQPVLVEFYKAGCPACATLEPGLDKLAKEYAGRVVFARFERSPSKDIRDTYHIHRFPTVILFVNGQERNRWVYHLNLDDYRKALDGVAVPTAGGTSTGD